MYQSYNNVTVGCLIGSGIVLYGYFWLLYTFHLILKLAYPLKSSQYSRTMYSLEVLLALFIATVPAIVGAGLSKYRISTFPPTQCKSDGEFRFYSLILPVMAAVCVSVIFMLLALYKIHVVSLMVQLY